MGRQKPLALEATEVTAASTSQASSVVVAASKADAIPKNTKHKKYPKSAEKCPVPYSAVAPILNLHLPNSNEVDAFLTSTIFKCESDSGASDNISKGDSDAKVCI